MKSIQFNWQKIVKIYFYFQILCFKGFRLLSKKYFRTTSEFNYRKKYSAFFVFFLHHYYVISVDGKRWLKAIVSVYFQTIYNNIIFKYKSACPCVICLYTVLSITDVTTHLESIKILFQTIFKWMHLNIFYIILVKKKTVTYEHNIL